MVNTNTNTNVFTQQKLPHTSISLRHLKFRWCILLLLLIVLIVLLNYTHYLSHAEFSQILTTSYHLSSTTSILFENKTTIPPSIPRTNNSSEIVIEMKDRVPTYKLATETGNAPYADGDRAQAKVLDELHLYEICQRDPSTIVVDVGAFLGDFGLYAAACGCTVYIFEIQPPMVTLIRSSIQHNGFNTSRVQLLHTAVSDLPSNSTVNFSIKGGETTTMNGSVSIQTIRLDDINWTAPSIFLLKIDVEGFELNVLRSAKKLFDEKRIRHVIFEYTAWWTERAPQSTLIPYVQNELKAKFLYALHRTGNIIYGPLNLNDSKEFYDHHVKSHLQTDIYAVFDDKANSSSIKAEPYNLQQNSA